MTLLVRGLVYAVLIVVKLLKLRVPMWKEKALPTMLYRFKNKTQRLLKGHRANSIMIKTKLDTDKTTRNLIRSWSQPEALSGLK
jgi:hypothetical protein